MESPDDYTRWIERAARRLEEAMRNDDVKQAQAEMKLIERTLKVLRQKFAEHIANLK
jgi:HAMP domain-containing protein